MTCHQSHTTEHELPISCLLSLGDDQIYQRLWRDQFAYNYRAVWSGLSWPYRDQRFVLQRMGKITSFFLPFFTIFLSLDSKSTFSWLRQHKAFLLSGCCTTQDTSLLCRLQAQTLPDATPPPLSSKMSKRRTKKNTLRLLYSSWTPLPPFWTMS